MSSKVVEANAGIHSLAMAVAVRAPISVPVRLQTDQLQPVTSWRLYGQSALHFTSARDLLVTGIEGIRISHSISSDSIYTERYMDTPQNNPSGYVNASISNVEGFKNVDFLLAHGTGDDNGRCCRWPSI